MIEVDCRKCVNCTGEECIPLEQALKAEYNKAIDDFVKMAYEELLYSEHLTKIDIDYIAEQLKEGGKNGKKKYIELS